MRSGPDPDCGVKCSNKFKLQCFICWLGVTLAVSAVVIVPTVFAIRYTTLVNDTTVYYQDEAHFISYSNHFCQQLKINQLKVSHFIMSVMMIDSPPKLPPWYDDTFVDYFIQSPIEGVTDFRHYRMHPGSHFTMNACIYVSGDGPLHPVLYYFIKGKEQYYEWLEDPNFPAYTLEISTSCDVGNDTYSASITADDLYYQELYTKQDKSVANIYISYDQTRYKSIGYCNNREMEVISCTLDVPDYKTMVYVTTGYTYPPNLDHTQLSIYCVPRYSTYIGISAGILVVVAIVTGAAAMCYVRRRFMAPQLTGSPLLSHRAPLVNQPEPRTTYGSNQ